MRKRKPILNGDYLDEYFSAIHNDTTTSPANRSVGLQCQFGGCGDRQGEVISLKHLVVGHRYINHNELPRSRAARNSFD
jgi:hypothetical protein